MESTLLIELRTEELPPKALKKLSDAFSQEIFKGLQAQQLLSAESAYTSFATPRRLAVQVSHVLQQAPEQTFIEKLMPARIGIVDGAMSPALIKKLSAKGLDHLTLADLVTEHDGKQDYLLAKGVRAGAVLAEQINQILHTVIQRLPIPKVMTYQLSNGDTVKFVRPVHGLMVMLGAQLIEACVLGVNSQKTTLGHRFLSEGEVEVPHALAYEEALYSAHVVASYEKRRALILEQLETESQKFQATIQADDTVEALLDEVCSLVEYPRVYPAKFEERFLQVPQECLILTMRLNQKYFPLFDQKTGRLINHFLIVSNMDIEDPKHIILGNERVIRPRLADAEFFFETDRKVSLADRVERLSNMVYHNKLGSQKDRVGRLQAISSFLAAQLLQGTEHIIVQAEQAAFLSKADLATEMVGEFPELQGIMGSYYAGFEGVDEAVAYALSQQYQVRFEPLSTTDVLRKDIVAACLFMADRLDTLVGIWGIGLKPTGERDPFGLRRAALGIISVIDYLKTVGVTSAAQPLDIDVVLAAVQSCIEDTSYEVVEEGEVVTKTPELETNTAGEVKQFIYDRLKHQLIGDFEKILVDAVIATQPAIEQVMERLIALQSFAALPEAKVLVAGNKRITNFLKKIEDVGSDIEPTLFEVDAERNLYQLWDSSADELLKLYYEASYTEYLVRLAAFAPAVDDFFENVMVMVEDEAVRTNRLNLLAQLNGLMNRVADLSVLDV